MAVSPRSLTSLVPESRGSRTVASTTPADDRVDAIKTRRLDTSVGDRHVGMGQGVRAFSV